MSSFWSRLSNRERALAAATLSVVFAAIVALVLSRAFAYVMDLDEQIDSLQLELVNNEQQMLRIEPVNNAFARIAGQHSSRWTAEEIRDGLHREIYRLALQSPGQPAQPGAVQAAAAPNSNAPRIVDIPSLPDGVLKAQGDGYREYTIDFRIQAAGMEQLTLFLARLQESPQVLRVDSLNVVREMEDQRVNAQIQVTRTVVDGVETSGDSPAVFAGGGIVNGGFEQTGSPPEGWQMEGAMAGPTKLHVTEGATALAVIASNDGGRLWQEMELEAGETYELSLDAAATGDAALSVGAMEPSGERPGTMTPYGAPAPLRNDGSPYRYVFQFSPPGDAGTAAAVGIQLALQRAAASVYIDNMTLRPVSPQ